MRTRTAEVRVRAGGDRAEVGVHVRETIMFLGGRRSQAARLLERGVHSKGLSPSRNNLCITVWHLCFSTLHFMLTLFFKAYK